MDTKLFDYHLPPDLIAETPVDRGDSRMMIVDRKNGTFTHSLFRNITDFIDNATTVVFNSTKVIPARIFGKRVTGGVVEFLLIKNIGNDIWQVMVKCSKRLNSGEKISFPKDLEAEIIARDGQFADVRFSMDGNSLLNYLDSYGDIPLPPYILKKRNEKKSRIEDREKYQTVYATVPGSVAAPTAGLHFNDEILNIIKKKTEDHIENVVLDVGLGTFLPVKSDKIEEHTMHREHFVIDENTAKRLNADKCSKKTILAVGTTTVRALESAADDKGVIQPSDKETGIFIYPGYKYKFVDRILTNFHLPQSTLLMMISAFADRDFILEAYEEAVKEKYRFYSYGDCMLIV
jgi:S-adenosylmethionine:tRNA ribosyltransferase-isomerase